MGNSNGSSSTTTTTTTQAQNVNGAGANHAVILQEDEAMAAAQLTNGRQQLMPGVFGVTSTSSPSQQMRFTNHMSTLQKREQSAGNGNKTKGKPKDNLLNSSFGKECFFWKKKTNWNRDILMLWHIQDFNVNVQQQQRPQQSTFLGTSQQLQTLMNTSIMSSLLSGENNSVPYTALYDYVASLDKHLTMHRGDQLLVLSYNKSREWCEVQNMQSGLVGWVPASYIKPFNSLENYPW